MHPLWHALVVLARGFPGPNHSALAEAPIATCPMMPHCVLHGLQPLALSLHGVLPTAALHTHVLLLASQAHLRFPPITLALLHGPATEHVKFHLPQKHHCSGQILDVHSYLVGLNQAVSQCCCRSIGT
eukprot:7091438-Lingulodinium_polyedra.AAC.1